jgi:RND family efflux transporter MFP subunit
MRVEIRLIQNPRQVFLGEVVRVALEADPQTHRFSLEISLVNLQEKFLPGMAVQIKIRGPFMKNVLLVDKSAVREQQGESYLFVLKGSSAELRSVILGPESDGKLIVHSGVKEGEQIIISPPPGLVDGDTVEISH